MMRDIPPKMSGAIQGRPGRGAATGRRSQGFDHGIQGICFGWRSPVRAENRIKAGLLPDLETVLFRGGDTRRWQSGYV